MLVKDPFAQYWSPYNGMGNDPINGIDPNGGITKPLQFCRECTGTMLQEVEVGGSRLLGFEGLRESLIDYDLLNVQAICPTCLDPSTIRRNLFGMSYPGGLNPQSYDKTWNYSYVPTRKPEFPAIGYDRRYDNLGIEGPSGLFFDTRAVGADWKFVKEEFSIAFNQRNRNEKEKLDALFVGIGVAVQAAFKTIPALLQPGGIQTIKFWYRVSSHGVTNNPSPPVNPTNQK